MTLSDYLSKNSKSRAAFAADIGVTPEAVRLWVEGERIPTPRMMRKIVDATKSAVSPNDFFTRAPRGASKERAA